VAVYAITIDWVIAGTVVTAVATVALAIFTAVTLRFLGKQEARAVQERYDQHRPLLYPIDGLAFVDPLNGVDWSAQHAALTLQNAGSGVALAVATLLLGPNDPHDTGMTNRFAAWYRLPMPADATPHKLDLRLGNSTVSKTDTIGSHSLCAPDKPTQGAMLIGGAAWCPIRLTITYTDIFHRKHASIFDYTIMHHWRPVEFLEDVPKDLYALQADQDRAAAAAAMESPSFP